MASTKSFVSQILLIAILVVLSFYLPNAVTVNLGNLALVRVALQHDTSSIALAQRWLSSPTMPSASLRSLTKLNLLRGAYGEAIEAGEQAVAQKPNDLLATYWLGQAYALSGDKDTARRIWRDSGAVRGRLQYFGTLCWQQASLGNVNAAEAALREAMDLDPEWVPAYDSLASLWWGRDWQKVSWALDRAITHTPERSAAWYWNVGRRQIVNGDWALAAQSLRAAADLEPNQWRLRYLRDALRRLGDTSGAAKVQTELDALLER